MQHLGRRDALLLAAVLLAACAGWEPETDAERALRQSREKLQSSVGQGGLVGAAGGAVLGGAVGGAEGAFRGAEIGRLGGAAAGAYVRKLQAEYASNEAVLDRVAGDLQATNVELERSISAMRAVLAETRLKGSADPVRVERNAAEAQQAVAAAVTREQFFLGAARVLSGDGVDVGASPVAPELQRLSERVRAMRSIADDLAS